MSPIECETPGGACAVENPHGSTAPLAAGIEGFEVVYIGDPMCSWCWGIAPAVRQLCDYCAGQGVPFRVVVGGLRPGGGDPWNAQFRQFLAHHWREVAAKTGQPFSFRLLDRDSFHYDTEPACRAVVAARSLSPERELEFFAAVQRKFYVDNEDPAEPGFYRSICAALGLDFATFAERFESADARAETRDEFLLNRGWGVTGYPTILVRQAGRLTRLATGFATFEDLRQGLRQAVPRLA